MTGEERLKAFGSSATLPEKLELRAGALNLIYENGAVRWIKLGNIEIIRMIYSAVRDRNWGTVESVIESENIEIGNNSFEINLTVGYHSDPIHFTSEYRIWGSDNRIRFEMNGLAQSDFLKNRIGFCVLHPVTECAGKNARAIHSDGTTSDFQFPEFISPNQPIKNLKSISWNPTESIEAKLEFSGAVFEMEDQRNWTDASYKTYCTPLELPFPAEIKCGEKVSQVVELTVETGSNPGNQSDDFIFSWDIERVSRLSELGTAISSRKETLTHPEIDLLQKLPFNHLRVEVKMNEPDYTDVLGRADRESKLLSWPLFVVLYLSENYVEEYRQFASFCVGLNVRISHILPVGTNHLPFFNFERIAELIRSDFRETLVGTGVNAYFAELNRARPKVEKADFINFTICPQVHAFDHASLVENIEAQAETIKSATSLFPEKPIMVSPVSFRQRFNVVATAAEPDPEPGTLPSSVDVRQRSVFAASWTLGSLKTLTQSGCSLVSYFETVGWKGIMQGEKPSPVKKLFPASADELFPIYEALYEMSGSSLVVYSESSRPLLFDGIVLKSTERNRLYLWSFSENEMEVELNQSIQILSAKSFMYLGFPELSGVRLKLRPMDLTVLDFI